MPPEGLVSQLVRGGGRSKERDRVAGDQSLNDISKRKEKAEGREQCSHRQTIHTARSNASSDATDNSEAQHDVDSVVSTWAGSKLVNME